MKSKGTFLCLSLFLALILGLSPSILASNKATHMVKKGDTLWSICERYYGDPFLWPELWEMNKFITNPHWINPGDEITLLKYEEKQEKPKPVEIEVKRKKEPIAEQLGIDVSSLTNTKYLGFLGKEKIEPWGQIFDFKTEKILLGEGDTVYVKMYKDNIKPGDIFTVYDISDPVKHPVTGNTFGYTYSFKGILEIEKAMENYHVAKIKESFRAIYKDDLLMPYRPVSSCITLVPCDEKNFMAYILASKDNLDLLAQHSVVYIDAGFYKKVYRGNIFEVIEERESKPQKQGKVVLPPAVSGKLLILDTTEDTSTGIVFWASKNFANGAKIRPHIWEEQPRELAILPTCPIR
ncbi:MAG TPA: LysM domain-containing protein [Desulfatiglandales bacterium]|nr:LysM domain-containing protein [Desulfatiglandales bacterium]